MGFHRETKINQCVDIGRILINMTQEVIKWDKEHQITEIFEAFVPSRDKPDKTMLQTEPATLAALNKKRLKQENITTYPTRGITKRLPVSAALMCQVPDPKFIELFSALQFQLAEAVLYLDQFGKTLTSESRLYEASRLIRTLAMPEGLWLLELIFRQDPF
jgi:hypothetical protein